VTERVRYVEDIIPPGHRLGIRVLAHVVWLREGLRLPVNLIQRHLERAGLKVSQGEIEHITSEVAEERSRAPPGEWEERAARWKGQVLELARREWTDPGCQRIAKRLVKHAGELFTSLVCPMALT